jgi:predicted amidohydrolase
MKIAVAQLASRAGDVEHNVAVAINALADAGDARVVVLPELFLTGYAMPPSTLSVDDPRLAPLERAASEAGALVLAGAAVDSGTARPFISTVLFGGGTPQRAYNKMHLSGQEVTYFQAGKQPVMLEVDGWKLGLSICYDGSFAEHARAYAVAGADAYVASIAFYAGSEHRRDLYYRSRALDNGFFSVVSALVGPCGGAQFNGGAAVYDPEGRPMAQARQDGRDVVVVELDRGLIEATRQAHPMLADRLSIGEVRQLAVS